MLDGTTALVTGASGGIGREIALTLADHGANVTLAARSEGIYETADLIGDKDATLPVETDVTDEGDVERTIERTVAAFGGLDCLVNNVGIAGPTKPVEEVTVEEWRHTMDVNVLGHFLPVKYATSHLRESDRGSVINISSISGKRPLENRTPYTGKTWPRWSRSWRAMLAGTSRHRTSTSTPERCGTDDGEPTATTCRIRGTIY